MAATHGHLGEFDSTQEEWETYTERLEQYFTANDVQDAEKQRAILLSCCGASTYRLIKNVLAPNRPTDVPFDDIVTQMRTHFHPTPSETVQRYLFYSRTRRAGESVSMYVAELKKLAEFCNFGDTLEPMLRDRIVCGIGNERWQRRLLGEEDLTYKSAMKIVLALESADSQVKELQGATKIHHVRKPWQSQRPKRQDTIPQIVPCFRCGGKHEPKECRFKDSECHLCHKKGHISKVCRKKTWSQHGKRTATPHGTNTVAEPDEVEYPLHALTTGKNHPLTVKVKINNADLQMEVDTGATLSIISKKTYERLWPTQKLAPLLKFAHATLKTYTGEQIKVLGSIDVNVTYQTQKRRLPLLVVAGDGPSLLGRDWLQQIKLDWSGLYAFSVAGPKSQWQDVIDRHPDAFKDELGRVQGTTAKFYLKSGIKPKFLRARPVPYALREKVERELDRLQANGVIEPVQFSDWAAPIVPIVKKDGSVRICGDYKLTVNQAAKTDTYPLPRIHDLFASLSGGTTFSKLDLAHAYQQIPLEEDSKQYVTVNTHKGLYRYNRLPFGVASAPSIFQRTMENILQGLPGVTVYIDDILVTGKSTDEHLYNLETVLQRLEQAGLRLKREKCSFMLTSVEYLGYKISEKGLQPTDEKITAIKNAPVPKNVSQLKSFLGLINYYSTFLPNLSHVLSPLYRLLQKTTPWSWGSEQQKCFEKARSMLTSNHVLVHFDPEKELILACDASPYGIGAVLSHRMPDGLDKPIAFASRSLAPAERKYSQIEKEGLAIVFGVKKFHQYLFGRHFTILSDHKPLQHLFSETKGTPTMASARIQRWAMVLGAYDYSISYKPGEQHANADLLSRLPLPDFPTNVPTPGETVLLMSALQSSPITANEIRQWTARDPLLAKVKDFILHGWRDTSDNSLKPFQQRKNELSIESGCILWGNRVVVPPRGRQQVIDELHEGHPGISRMKSLARSFVWWPGMDNDLEKKVKECFNCQSTRHRPPPAPLHPWEWPERPWSRLHADYAGPFLGKMFLIVVDAYSKWLEVIPVSSATSLSTIEQFRSIFSIHGLPEVLVTDNGTAFTSTEFAEFMKRNGVRHVKSAPYHPASNGLAERAVQTFKESMRKQSKDSLNTRIARFLFSYRITPHTTTGTSPAELLFSRLPRSHLDLLKPTLAGRVLRKQEKQKENHDVRSKERTFQVGDFVFICDFPDRKHWLSGKIISTKGPCSYLVELEDGRIVRRHVDHIRACTSNSCSPPTDVSAPLNVSDDDLADISIPTPPLHEDSSPVSVEAPQPTLRRSTRISRPPDRYF